MGEGLTPLRIGPGPAWLASDVGQFLLGGVNSLPDDSMSPWKAFPHPKLTPVSASEDASYACLWKRALSSIEVARVADNKCMNIPSSALSAASAAAAPAPAPAAQLTGAAALSAANGTTQVKATADTPGASGDQGPAAAVDPQAVISRLDNYANGVATRLREAYQDVPESAQGEFLAAVQSFTGNLERVRAGIEDGSLRGDDLASAVQGTLGTLRGDLIDSRSQAQVKPAASSVADRPTIDADVDGQSGTPAAALGAALVDQDVQDQDRGTSQDVTSSGAAAASNAQNAAAVSRGRFGNIVQGVSSRIQSLQTPEMSDGMSAAIEAAQQAFQSATARIDTAFFQNGDFDRSTFYGLYSASLGRLQQSLGDLFSGSQKTEATLYDANRGVQSLSDGLERVKLDRTI